MSLSQVSGNCCIGETRMSVYGMTSSVTILKQLRGFPSIATNGKRDNIQHYKFDRGRELSNL